jgi:hypothetical protein
MGLGHLIEDVGNLTGVQSDGRLDEREVFGRNAHELDLLGQTDAVFGEADRMV